MQKHVFLIIGIGLGTVLSMFILTLKVTTYERTFFWLVLFFQFIINVVLFYLCYLISALLFHHKFIVNGFLLGFFFSVILQVSGALLDSLRGVVVKNDFNSFFVYCMFAPATYLLLILFDLISKKVIR